MTNPLIELVESCINDCLRGSVFFSEDDARKSKALIDGTLSELRTRLEALERVHLALSRLCRHFPTDEDMEMSGSEAEQINAACNAYDEAMAALAAMEAANVPER